MSAYIGPERRKGERRTGTDWPYGQATDLPSERRVTPERRQEDLAGVIVGFTPDDMATLVALWQQRDRLVAQATAATRALKVLDEAMVES